MKEMKYEDISIVVPTLNSRHLIEPIAEQMRESFSHVGEVVVVDSFSEDGTMELLQSILDFDAACFFSRPRGLYDSWNFGIEKCSKKWIYIATAGDIIDLEDLDYLYSTAESHDVDVVTSLPQFFNEDGEQLPDLKWPIASLLQRFEGLDEIHFSGLDLISFALTHCRPGKYNGWMGSSASNIYRTQTLKNLPFRTDVGPIGDSLWGLQNSPVIRACFCRRRCGRFVVHDRDSAFLPNDRIGAIFGYTWVNLAKRILKQQIPEENEFTHFLSTTFDRELEAGELTRKLRLRIRRLLSRLAYYMDYIHEGRVRIPRMFWRVLLPSLKRGKVTLESQPLPEKDTL